MVLDHSTEFCLMFLIKVRTIRETDHTPWEPCFSKDIIHFCYSFKHCTFDHFCQIILNSDQVALQ